jgi:hypothetical protein
MILLAVMKDTNKYSHLVFFKVVAEEKEELGRFKHKNHFGILY